MVKPGPGLETAFKQTAQTEILKQTAEQRGEKILAEEAKKNSVQRFVEDLPGAKQIKDWRDQKTIKKDLETIANAQQRLGSPDTQEKES